ncbi:MAG: CehA/McbA family metallohydrolase [Pirellulaceae bacterium]
MKRWALVISLAAAPLLGRHVPSFAAANGELEITVVDKDSRQPLAVRMHLQNSRGKPVQPPKTVYWKNHFVFDGTIRLELRPGSYTFEIERGPEYRVRHGHFEIQRGAEGQHAVVMERFVDMKQEGWWSGELHVHRPLEHMELLMRAEDLHVAPVITWWNNRNLWADQKPPEDLLVSFDENRFYHVMGGEDEREGGALMYFNAKTPLPIAGSSREYPSSAEFLLLAHEQPGIHIDIEKPFWWDVPLWIASNKVHSMGIAHNHMWRDGVLATEAWGKPRDTSKYPNPHGNARWSLDIYYHLLNCGIRLPPSAGSASGVLPNPVGYNRVYVYCGEELTYERWWEGLRAGQVVVTNGPMLRPRVNGELPGHVFSAPAGEKVVLDIALELALREKVEYLQVIRNGRVDREVRLDEVAKKGGRFPEVVFQESGWMLIRAVTNNQQTYRFASTGPYYVEIGNQPRISKASAQFFLDWVHERAAHIRLDDADQRADVMRYHRAARDFWQKKVDAANAE